MVPRLCDVQMRVLALQISELERSIHTSKVSMPDLPGIDKDIAILKADLLRVRQTQTRHPPCSQRSSQCCTSYPVFDSFLTLSSS